MPERDFQNRSWGAGAVLDTWPLFIAVRTSAVLSPQSGSGWNGRRQQRAAAPTQDAVIVGGRARWLCLQTAGVKISIFGLPWGACVLFPSRPFSAKCSACWCWVQKEFGRWFWGEWEGQEGINSCLWNEMDIPDIVWLLWPLHCLHCGSKETAEGHQCFNCLQLMKSGPYSKGPGSLLKGWGIWQRDF